MTCTRSDTFSALSALICSFLFGLFGCALARTPNDVVLKTLAAGAFATTELARRRPTAGVESVVVVGVLTDVCVKF